MSIRVPGWGSVSSKLVLIGEAPAKWEVRQGKPFVGPSGHTLDRWWHEVGLSRRLFHIDNVFPYRAPQDKIAKADRDEVEAWAATVHPRLAKLTDPWLVVPTGNVALRALMRRPLWRQDSPKVTDWRGSIMPLELDDGRVVKMIPTIHPAATFRQPSLAKLCRADWRRISDEVHVREIELPERTHYIGPGEGIMRAYTATARERGSVLAVDIETNPSTREILCVGFSFSPYESITLPWADYYDEIKALCESPCEKVLQNGHYDTFWLAEEGIRVVNWKWDTLALHHSIDATLPHDLATMASLYTRQPFWKRDHKDEDTIQQMDLSKIDALYRYCGVDACVTRELLDVFLAMKEAA